MSVFVFGTGKGEEVKTTNVTAQIDGETQNFTVPETYKAGSLKVYWNGVRQIKDVTITELTSTTFSVSFVPLVGDYLLIDYSPP